MDLKQGIPFDAVSPYKDGVYAFSAFPPKAENLENDDDFLLSVIDKNGNLIEQAVKREDCTFTMGNISQSMNNSYFLRPQSSNHIFYKLTNKGVVAEYKIDFEDKTIPARYYYDSANESMRTYMMSDYYKLPMDLHETAAALSFHASGPQGDDVWFVYDKAKKNGFRWINESEDMIMPIIASDKEWFYTIIEILEAGSDEINHGLLYDAILNTMPNDFEAGRMYIVKFKI